jgi:hypothetical protein
MTPTSSTADGIGYYRPVIEPPMRGLILVIGITAPLSLAGTTLAP